MTLHGQPDQVIPNRLSSLIAASKRQGRDKKAQRQGIAHINAIVEYIGRHDVSEWPGLYEQVLQTLASYFQRGGSYLASFKVLGNKLANQAYGVVSIPVLGQFFMGDLDEYDINMARARAILSSAFFRYIGHNTERSISFFEMMLDDYAGLEKQHHAKRWTRDNLSEVKFQVPILRTLYTTLSCPVHDHFPSKGWFHNIIESALLGEAAGKACLRGIIEMSHLAWGVVPVIAASQHAFTLSSPFDYKRDFLTDPLEIVVADHLVDVVQSVQEEIQHENRKNTHDADLLLTWILQNLEALSKSFDQKCSEILNSPRYAIRPYGYDSILARVSLLRKLALSSFVFFPQEGQMYYDVMIQFNFETFGGRLCQIEGNLRNFNLEIDERFLQKLPGGLFPGLIHTIFEYVIVDSLHRIICRHPDKNLADERIDRAHHEGAGNPKRSVVVRPFIRRLPEGQQASEQARRLASQAFGWVLPKGVTFVSSHKRWAGLPEGKPAPLFRYTDEMLIKSIG